METIIVLLVAGLVSILAFFLVKSILSNSNEKNKTLTKANGLSREEIKEKFSHLNSMATQVRI